MTAITDRYYFADILTGLKKPFVDHLVLRGSEYSDKTKSILFWYNQGTNIFWKSVRLRNDTWDRTFYLLDIISKDQFEVQLVLGKFIDSL